MHPFLVEEKRIVETLIRLHKTDVTAIAESCLHVPYLADRVDQRIRQLDHPLATVRRVHFFHVLLARWRRRRPLSRIRPCTASSTRARHLPTGAGRPATAKRSEPDRDGV
jgi:hypothetical protein